METADLIVIGAGQGGIPLAIEAGATWQCLEQSVHIHPTYGEALPSLARLLQTT
jgi:pyruvate/2-oxoglutarate dehydrogenase complex dihydrolipoamide dehydrogenase (E3) component